MVKPHALVHAAFPILCDRPSPGGGRGNAVPSHSLAFRRQAANKAGKQGSGIILPSVH